MAQYLRPRTLFGLKFVDYLNSQYATFAKMVKKRLSAWLGDKEVAKESLTEWKEYLTENGYEPVTVNSMLAMVNTCLSLCRAEHQGEIPAHPAEAVPEENKELTKDETGSGRGMSRKQIWAEMKAICKTAGVEASKVFLRNLRHHFARVFFGSRTM